jgi:hypothetical protein
VFERAASSGKVVFNGLAAGAITLTIHAFHASPCHLRPFAGKSQRIYEKTF